MFAAVAAVLLAVSPAEKTLGHYLKLVYAHGATTWVALAAFSAAGAAGLLHLLSGQPGEGKWYRWCRAGQRTALVLWVLAVPTKLAAMRLIWGAFFWEPRMPMTFQVLLLAVALHFIAGAVNRPRLISALNLGLAVLIWFLLAVTPQVMHPDNPIARSQSLVLKLSFAAIVVSLLAAAFHLARYYYLTLPGDVIPAGSERSRA